MDLDEPYFNCFIYQVWIIINQKWKETFCDDEIKSFSYFSSTLTMIFDRKTFIIKYTPHNTTQWENNNNSLTVPVTTIRLTKKTNWNIIPPIFQPVSPHSIMRNDFNYKVKIKVETSSKVYALQFVMCLVGKKNVLKKKTFFNFWMDGRWIEFKIERCSVWINRKKGKFKSQFLSGDLFTQSYQTQGQYCTAFVHKTLLIFVEYI